MARRNRYGSPAPKAAPKPIKVSRPTVDPDGLRQAYEWLPVDRDAGYKLAFDWYATNLTALLYGDPLDEARQKHYDRALKSKAQGDHTTFDGERQTAWTTALKFYERTWEARSLPKIADALAAVDMGTAPSRRVADIQSVLNMLNGAYEGMATFRVTFGDERESHHTEIALPIADLAAMVPMTPLKSALRELPTVAKLLSIVTDEDGTQTLDGGVFMTMLPTLLDKVSDWASFGDLAKKAVGKAPAAAKPPKAPGTARPASAARSSPKIKFSDSQVIRVPAPFVNGNGRAGKAGQAFDLMRDGMTFRQYRDAVVAANPKNGNWYVLDTLRWAVANGRATVG